MKSQTLWILSVEAVRTDLVPWAGLVKRFLGALKIIFIFVRETSGIDCWNNAFIQTKWLAVSEEND